MRTAIPLIFGMFFLVGCAAEVDVTPDGEPVRGPLGKADAVGTCSEVCDGPAPLGNCWCDPECVAFGDCCEDRQDFCPEPEDRVCGGPQDLPCAGGEYCHFDADTQACGVVGELGTCVAKPDLCAEVYAPVCGCDGETYSNACRAHSHGVNVVAETSCEQLDDI